MKVSMTLRSRASAALVAVTASFAVVGQASAAEPPAHGFYVGAMGGVSQFDDDGMFGGMNYDDSDTGYGAYGGYKFLKYLAVEARIADVGFNATALSGHVEGIIPFGQSGWELFGQIGIASLDTDFWGTKSAGSAGIGVRFYPTPNLGLAVQTDAYVFEVNDYGRSRNPSYGTTQFAIHYLFGSPSH